MYEFSSGSQENLGSDEVAWRTLNYGFHEERAMTTKLARVPKKRGRYYRQTQTSNGVFQLVLQPAQNNKKLAFSSLPGDPTLLS